MRAACLVLFFVSLCFGQIDPNQYCGGSPSFVSNAKPGLELRKVQVITRHGDRTPVNFINSKIENVVWDCNLNMQYSQSNQSDPKFPKRVFQKVYVPNQEILRGNCLFGQLTERGAQQHRTLGANFRQLYVEKYKFLSSSLDSSQIRLRSTDIERTLLSAYNFIEGLYPSSAFSKSSVLPMETVDNAVDFMWPNAQLCPGLNRVWSQVKKSSQFMSYYNQTLASFADRYGSIWGVNLTMDQMFNLNDIIRTRFCHQLAMPPQMDLVDAESIMLGVRVLDNMLNMPLDAIRFGSGILLQNLLQEFVAPQVASTRFRLWSGHDDTLRSLLIALVYRGDNNMNWPPLASHIALELWYNQTSQEQYVVAQFDGYVLQLQAPCASVFCSLKDFASLVQSYAVTLAQCQ